jgi:hypothetical protein
MWNIALIHIQQYYEKQVTVVLGGGTLWLRAGLIQGGGKIRK